MKRKVTLNEFLPIGETNITIQHFLHETAGARGKKYGVHICANDGKAFVLLTFASSYEEAFQIAKAAYQASPYPKVGVGNLVVHGVCPIRGCSCGGQWRPKSFPVDWSKSR